MGRRARSLGGGARVLPAALQEHMDELAVLGGFSNHVSMVRTGSRTTMSGFLASMVFAKSCAHARSITAIAVQSSMFDHHAVMAISRMILEASTMVAYLLDPVGEEEQAFRCALLRLHDTVGRIKLLRAFGQPADDLRAGREEVRAELEAHPSYRSLPEERRRRLSTGEEMFAFGMRAVATRIMGWDEAQFAGVYAYLSAHTHSAPMSFMRMADHQVDYFFPSDAQTDVVGFSVLVAIACLRRTTLRMIDLEPGNVDDFPEALLEEARALDAECPFFR